MLCPSCGSEVPADAKFCAQCGSKIEPMIGLTENDKSGGCSEQESTQNESLESESYSNSELGCENDPMNSQKKKKSRIYIAVAGCFLLLVIVVSVVASCVGSRPYDLDQNTTQYGITVSYPSNWDFIDMEKDGNKSSSKHFAAFEVFNQAMKGRDDSDLLSEVKKLKVKISSLEASVANLTGCQVGNYPAYKGQLSYAGDKGNIIFVKVDDDVIACFSLAEQSTGQRALSTTSAIVDSVKAAEFDVRTVSFIDDDGTSLGQEFGKDYGDGAAVESPEKIAKDGFVLTGWKEKGGNGDIRISKTGSRFTLSNITRDTAVVAQWAKTYKVTFSDGDGNVLETQQVEEGKSAKPSKSPSKAGFIFKGWDTSLDKINADTTITALWKAKPTASQNSAVTSAKSYLRTVGGFSYKRLFEQLKYEGFSDDDATYGVDECGANWMEQAEQSAKSYMKHIGGFSRTGLIRQLEYEGFTPDQAAHGADSVGL